MSRPWIINDLLTAIPETTTFWHQLVDWTGGHFMGGDYSHLKAIVEAAYAACPTEDRPTVVIRNASYFPPLDLPGCRQVALVQDIIGSSWQEDVIDSADHVVYNSAYTRAKTKEAAHGSSIIPLPVNFDTFRVLPSAINFDVVWIGSTHPVKGFDLLLEVMAAVPDLNFAIVLKDEVAPPLPSNARCWLRQPQEKVAEIINRARVGLCTSRVETQHLAGIEMGACGLPLVVPLVGTYYDRTAGVWGIRYNPPDVRSIVGALRLQLKKSHNPLAIRAYWQWAMHPTVVRGQWEELLGRVVEAANPSDCKSDGLRAFGGSSPPAPTTAKERR